jgi:hypothetical protein
MKITCDCCGLSKEEDSVVFFEASGIDPLYEVEHICKECWDVFLSCDRMSTIYSAIREVRRTNLRFKDINSSYGTYRQDWGKKITITKEEYEKQLQATSGIH